MDPFVAPLTGEDRDREQLVGAKAARLGAVMAAGLPVPEAFVITTRAFRAIPGTAADPLGQGPGLGSLRAAGESSLAGWAARQRAELAMRPVPDEVTGPVLEAYRGLRTEAGPALVAVRSSAATEDTLHASHAGLLTTVLAVRGEQALLEAVRECWAGVYAPRELAYRLRQGEPWHDFGTAVIVQRMVDPVAAGVLFTCDPAAGDDSTLVVEGTWGLGTEVVNGGIVPDTWTMRRGTGEIRHRRPGSKQYRSVLGRQGQGLLREPTPDDLRSRSCLTTEQVAQVAALGLRAEDALGVRVDVEWAWGAVPTAAASGRQPAGGVTGGDENGWWIVQARPVTTCSGHPGPD